MLLEKSWVGKWSRVACFLEEERSSLALIYLEKLKLPNIPTQGTLELKDKATLFTLYKVFLLLK